MATSVRPAAGAAIRSRPCGHLSHAHRGHLGPQAAKGPLVVHSAGRDRALVLWVRGTEDLRLTCISSVAIVGSRAATGYGQHVAIELAPVLAERGVGVVSGGAYGALSQQRSARAGD